jgi:hypothetical protein
MLLYSGKKHRDFTWTTSQCSCFLVSHTVTKGQEHWLIDRLLFLEIYSGSLGKKINSCR